LTFIGRSRRQSWCGIVVAYIRQCVKWSRLLVRYVLIIVLREWARFDRVRPEVRVGTSAFMGAVIAPFIVFGWPVARLWWLITGRRLPRPVGWLFPPPRMFVNPFRDDPNPPEIRELLQRPEYNWQPKPGDIPWWLNAWSRVGQVLEWQIPPKNVTEAAAKHTTWSRQS
jgi:hypothetical protein